ncbi:MAG: hypothetical protein HOZ81_09075 [Streptomyces sp.]|nr:hypothetical protein [Streptomyces sp.]NUS11153.1 hypothetical protein [Streptomyces sp.]NUS23677.1 hypothetical protein [Streptomyces sp.]
MTTPTTGAGSDDHAAWWSVRRAARAIAAREISAREYLDVLRRRIDTHNPALGLVVTLDERAADEAARADEATVRGEPRGPLHGIPMTVKDSFATRGLRTTAGTADLAAHVPTADADAVSRLRHAGAVVFGKTNLAENCADLQSANSVFGVSRNPWNPEVTTGGSSGGSAGAVAAGFTPVELGSDIAGSIRVPASHCGVFGHRPSHGVVPLAGHIPPYQPTRPDMAVAGPFARDVDDLELLLDVITAPAAPDRVAWQLQLPPARVPRRVALWDDDPYCPVDHGVRGALRRAAEALTAAGTPVEHARPAGITLQAADRTARHLLAEVGMLHYSRERIERVTAGSQPVGAELGAEFVAQSYRTWMDAHVRRERMRIKWQQFFTRYDAILLPVVPNLAPEHDDRPYPERRITVDGVERPYWDQLVWTSLTGICHLPTTVVPVSRDSRGVPIGVAVCGPYLEDRTTLAVARSLSGLLPGLGRPDPVRPTLG